MLKIKDWQLYQHYRDRSPPWIKLATNLFQNYDFSRMQDASKLLALGCWTLASRTKDGSIPADLEWIKGQCNFGDFINLEHFKELINKGYLIDASNALADCKQSACAEREGYREEREKKDNPLPPKIPVHLPDWLPVEAWAGFVEMRKKIKKPLTDRAIKLTIMDLSQLRKKGQDPEKVLDQSTKRNWAGVFEIKGDTNVSKSTQCKNHSERAGDAAARGLEKYESSLKRDNAGQEGTG